MPIRRKTEERKVEEPSRNREPTVKSHAPAARPNGITGPRIIRVANDMPGELFLLVHKTYVALMTNVWPNLQAYFSKEVTVGGKVRPMLEYGIDYVVGEAKLPSHFRRPRYPISYPKHSVVFRDGHHIQLVSSDQPESVAGRSAVHAIIEEMKHNKGEKLKTRLFPSLRGAVPRSAAQPITKVSPVYPIPPALIWERMIGLKSMRNTWTINFLKK